MTVAAGIDFDALELDPERYYLVRVDGRPTVAALRQLAAQLRERFPDAKLLVADESVRVDDLSDATIERCRQAVVDLGFSAPSAVAIVRTVLGVLLEEN